MHGIEVVKFSLLVHSLIISFGSYPGVCDEYASCLVLVPTHYPPPRIYTEAQRSVQLSLALSLNSNRCRSRRKR